MNCRVILCTITSLLAASLAHTAVYEVGPSQPLPDIGSVPWEKLAAGDTVRIHWREQPYREKWVLSCRGTAEKPVTVSGVPGPAGQLPVIDGEDATTRPQLKYWGQERSVVKIGGASVPDESAPSHIVLENLDIRGGLDPRTFIGRRGAVRYRKDAASLHVEIVDHLTLRNLALHGSGNGLVISASSKSVIVERCHFYDNGNPGSVTEHNAYTECDGLVFEGCHFGPLRAGCSGNNLKDRSAGLVVRYCWIEGGNRQLDLVDATGNPALNASPAYRQTHVHGNVLIEREGDGNNQFVHYGGDSGSTPGYRKGTLHFYHNTVVSTSLHAVVLFRLSSPEETVECHGNILHTTASGKRLSLMSTQGLLRLGKNWLTQGWVPSVDDFSGKIETLAPSLVGTAPGFVSLQDQDFSLAPGSPCLGAASELPAGLTPMLRRYVRHQQVQDLPAQAPQNLGAQ
ncbi:polysaccharide-degrading enzyme [Prosthecobacter fluviatilis]|uniref:Polysaccharide-degrading enzyme n=1 Tax=Prosthecobacter fluviatilis TaxID=445931 RepID=A0ABW0KUD0_9BACT